MPDALRKRKPGWVERLSPKAKLILATLLGVAIGLEIGVLVSRGGVEALYDMVTGHWVRNDDNAPLTDLFVLILMLIAIKIVYYSGSQLINSKRILSKIIFVLALISVFIVLDSLLPRPSIAFIMLFVGLFYIHIIGRIHSGLLIFSLLLLGVFPLLLRSEAEPTHGYLTFITSIAFLTYPIQVSLKRFLIPSRGVI